MEADQKIEYIDIKDLVLWTENPRDSINENAKDQDIVDLAMADRWERWTLRKLAKEMGDEYDFSELPTVVYHQEKPVVYDGNRRIILGKIKHNFAQIDADKSFVIPNFPDRIPCNVCTKEIALRNVLRKHADSGSWSPLGRDIFLDKHMKQGKSPFLILEESTGLISKNPHLNQRFVKEEIFTEDTFKKIGFEIKDKLYVKHSDKEALSILADISQKIHDKDISTRLNRGKVIEILDKSSKQIIRRNEGNKVRVIKVDATVDNLLTGKPKLSRRTKKSEQMLFGEILTLKTGSVNNLYRDISDIYQVYLDKKIKFSPSFIGLIRMSLRLLTELAAQDHSLKLDEYLEKHFANAKNRLDSDKKTTLASENVNQKSILQLLHTGAHNYKSSTSPDKAIAISIILGSILVITHGKTK